MSAKKNTLDPRARRHRRVRKKVRGTAERPRLAVFRSNNHIYAQVIDDVSRPHHRRRLHRRRQSLKGAATGNIDAATKVGALVAERAKAAGVAKVVFDRGGFRYHGRVAALADAARDGGLEF